MKRLGVTAIILGVLSGCTTASDQAWSNCVDGMAVNYRVEHGLDPDDTDDVAESVAAAGELCGELRDHDAALFESVWADPQRLSGTR